MTPDGRFIAFMDNAGASAGQIYLWGTQSAARVATNTTATEFWRSRSVLMATGLPALRVQAPLRCPSSIGPPAQAGWPARDFPACTRDSGSAPTESFWPTQRPPRRTARIRFTCTMDRRNHHPGQPEYECAGGGRWFCRFSGHQRRWPVCGLSQCRGQPRAW